MRLKTAESFHFFNRTAPTRPGTTTSGAWTTTAWPRPSTRSNTGRARSGGGWTTAGTDTRKLAGW